MYKVGTEMQPRTLREAINHPHIVAKILYSIQKVAFAFEILDDTNLTQSVGPNVVQNEWFTRCRGRGWGNICLTLSVARLWVGASSCCDRDPLRQTDSNVAVSAGH